MSGHVPRSRRSIAYAAAGAAVVGAGLVAPTVFAAAPSSTLVASPSTAITLDIGGPTTSSPVSVGLDANCLNLFSHSQSYTVAATSVNPVVATPSPANSTGLHCGDTYPFTVSTTSYAADPTAACAAVAAGPTAIDFSPVAAPPGIQKKLHATSVPVSVTDTGGLCGFTPPPPPPPPGDGVPAAPAVANAYLDADPALGASCKWAFGNAKSWRGGLISFIAHWMPKPESVKEAPPVGIFADPNDWILYVQTEVNHKCGYHPLGFVDYDTTGKVPPLSAYSP